MRAGSLFVRAGDMVSTFSDWIAPLMDTEKLRLEVWDDFDDEGGSLPALLYAGSLGEEARRLLGPKARLLTTIQAGCHFEAMTIYYELMGWGEYTTNQTWDYQPYPADWLFEQQRTNSGEPRS